MLFGFQLEGTFNAGFDRLSPIAKIIDGFAITGIVLALAAMIGAPAQHRMVERGDVSTRLLRTVGHLAAAALLFLAVVIGCDGFIVSERYIGTPLASLVGAVAFLAALGLWFGLGWWVRPPAQDSGHQPDYEQVSLHEKIEQVLNEAWVVLPGATGILGFQLMITSLPIFDGSASLCKGPAFCCLGLHRARFGSAINARRPASEGLLWPGR